MLGFGCLYLFSGSLVSAGKNLYSSLGFISASTTRATLVHYFGHNATVLEHVAIGFATSTHLFCTGVQAFAGEYHHHVDGRDVVIVDQLLDFLQSKKAAENEQGN